MGHDSSHGLAGGKTVLSQASGKCTASLEIVHRSCYILYILQPSGELFNSIETKLPNYDVMTELMEVPGIGDNMMAKHFLVPGIGEHVQDTRYKMYI